MGPDALIPKRPKGGGDQEFFVKAKDEEEKVGEQITHQEVSEPVKMEQSLKPQKTKCTRK